jgi:hypothetical protein
VRFSQPEEIQRGDGIHFPELKDIDKVRGAGIS